MILRWFRGRRRLEHSFAISTALLVVVLIGTTMVVVHSRVASTLRKGLEARGLSIARSIGAVATPSLFAYNFAALQIAAERASEDTGATYVVIHDKEGNIAGVAGPTPASFILPSRTLAARHEPAVSNVEVDGGHGKAEAILEVAVPVCVEGVDEPWGTVRVGLSYASAVADLRRIDLGLILVGLTLAIGAVISGRWVARRITAPLRQLAEGTEALSAGEMSHRIPVTGARELADLAAAFNLMMGRLQEKAAELEMFHTALETMNTTLEDQVKERTRALQESEAQYKTLVEHSPDSILILQGGRVRFVNRAFTEVFGISEEEALEPDFTLDRIFDPSSADLALNQIEAWTRGEPASLAEVQGLDASGQVRHLELRGSRIEFRGQPAAECILIDMTEAKRLREQLAQSEKMRSLGELAGGVAHDFNNLLGAILGRTQLLRRRDFDPETDHELAVIEKAAQDGRDTVRRIQEFSRTRRERKFSPLDLDDILRDSVEITRTRWKTDAERRNVKIEMALETDPVPPIMGNAAELREVFTNLILNAIDAMPQGGLLRLSCRSEGDLVVAEVEDSGVGMTEEIRHHLFDPFYTTKGHGGTGLGMSVVYGIVTRHEGSIEVATALSKGTTFHLSFPVASEVEAQEKSVPPVAPVREPGRILVIDDEPEIAEVLKDVLAGDGHLVETALTGTDGLKLAGMSHYDLIFTDLGMPDLSGWEVARRIITEKPDAQVALVTGWGATLNQDEIDRHGIVAVVHKPFDIDDLTRTTMELLATARQTGHQDPSPAGDDPD